MECLLSVFIQKAVACPELPVWVGVASGMQCLQNISASSTVKHVMLHLHVFVSQKIQGNDVTLV